MAKINWKSIVGWGVAALVVTGIIGGNIYQQHEDNDTLASLFIILLACIPGHTLFADKFVTQHQDKGNQRIAQRAQQGHPKILQTERLEQKQAGMVQKDDSDSIFAIVDESENAHGRHGPSIIDMKQTANPKAAQKHHQHTSKGMNTPGIVENVNAKSQ